MNWYILGQEAETVDFFYTKKMPVNVMISKMGRALPEDSSLTGKE